MKKIIPLFVMLWMASCSLAPDYQRPEIMQSNQWKDKTAVADAIDANWWHAFGSKKLDDLVIQAVQYNVDLEAAIHRIDQARAQAKIAGAGLYPSASADGSYGIDDAKRASTTRSWDLGGSVSYEVDLWQRNRNAAKAADYNLNATIFDRDTLALVVASETVQRYAEILTFKERIRITENTIKVFQDTLKIVEARFDEGSSSGLEVAQQRTTLANTQALLANLRQQMAFSQSALALLLGQAPQDFSPSFHTTITALNVPKIAPLQPSSLLERRPDIRAQEEALKAANADIGVARAELFPGLTLSASAGLLANPATATPVWSTGAAASVLQRIFAGGALRGQVELTQARKAELVENYRSLVLNAFKETQDALVTIKQTEIREKNLKIALAESRKAYQIAKDRYDNGASDFLSLLDAQRTLLSAQENDITVRLERLNAAILLYKALGGGWKE